MRCVLEWLKFRKDSLPWVAIFRYGNVANLYREKVTIWSGLHFGSSPEWRSGIGKKSKVLKSWPRGIFLMLNNPVWLISKYVPFWVQEGASFCLKMSFSNFLIRNANANMLICQHSKKWTSVRCNFLQKVKWKKTSSMSSSKWAPTRGYSESFIFFNVSQKSIENIFRSP